MPPPNIKLHLTICRRGAWSTSPLLGSINIVFFCRLLLNVYFRPLLEKQCGDKVSNQTVLRRGYIPKRRELRILRCPATCSPSHYLLRKLTQEESGCPPSSIFSLSTYLLYFFGTQPRDRPQITWTGNPSIDMTLSNISSGEDTFKLKQKLTLQQSLIMKCLGNFLGVSSMLIDH